MKGFIKDYRRELQSDIWSMPPLYHRVWQYLKYKVNHKKRRIPLRDGSFITVLPGQHLTSIRNIASGVSWYERGVEKTPNPRTISNILDWLEKQSMVAIDRGNGNRQYTLITLLNWDLYQSNDDKSNSGYTDSAPVRQQSVHINKNDKECIKNDKNTTKSTREENFPGVENMKEKNKIINRYLELKGSMHFTPKDEMAAEEIANENIPLEDVLRYLEDCFLDFETRKRHSRDKINSLQYCVGYIFDRHYKKDNKTSDKKDKSESQYDDYDYGF